MSDYSSELKAIKDLNPDLIYFGGINPQGGFVLAKGIEDYLPGVKMMGADGIWTQAFVDAAGEGSDGVYATSLFAPFYELQENGDKKFLTEEGKKFYYGYASAFLSEAGTYSCPSYEAARLVIRAIEDAGVKDRAKIIEAMSKIKDYNSIYGVWSFDEDGDITQKIISGNQVENGKFVFRKVLT